MLVPVLFTVLLWAYVSLHGSQNSQRCQWHCVVQPCSSSTLCPLVTLSLSKYLAICWRRVRGGPRALALPHTKVLACPHPHLRQWAVFAPSRGYSYPSVFGAASEVKSGDLATTVAGSKTGTPPAGSGPKAPATTCARPHGAWVVQCACSNPVARRGCGGRGRGPSPVASQLRGLRSSAGRPGVFGVHPSPPGGRWQGGSSRSVG